MITRLRNPFITADADADADADPLLDHELDEATQETLITSLATRDAAQTALYRNAFLALPVTTALYLLFGRLLFFPTTTDPGPGLSPQQRLLTLLSISSLACTAYILYFMPLRLPERKGKVSVYKIEAAKGPVERYLVALNAALSGVLGLVAVVGWGRGLREEALPGIVCALTMAARQVLAPVDLDELRGARFGYKGA